VSTDYAGNLIYPATITVLEDSDLKDAASVAVALEQLADRTAYLNGIITGGIDLEFTNATFHGATNFADGTSHATITDFELSTTTHIQIGAGTTVDLAATAALAINAGAELGITAGTDLIVDVGDDIIVTGEAGSELDIFGGRVIIRASGAIDLGAALNLGGGTGDAVAVLGTLAAAHNATFASGKTVTLSGATTASDLRATVSNAAGITYSSQGRAHYRTREIVDADFGLGLYIMAPSVADIFYIQSLTANRTIKLNDSGSTDGDVIELSTLGMTGGFSVEIYDEAEANLLLTMTATGNSYSRWVKKVGGTYRLLCVSDG